MDMQRSGEMEKRGYDEKRKREEISLFLLSPLLSVRKVLETEYGGMLARSQKLVLLYNTVITSTYWGFLSCETSIC